MKKMLAAALLFAAAVPAVAQDTAAAPAATAAVATKGKMLLAAGGSRLAPVYRVAADGSPQLILDGKLVTVPASTLTSADGKLMTTLSKREVLARN